MLGAATIGPIEFIGQVLGAADVSVVVLSAQDILSLSVPEKQVYLSATKGVLVSKITELISLLQQQLAAAITAGGNF